MTTSFLNNCIWLAASRGTASFVVGTAYGTGYKPSQCLTPAVTNGATYHYFAQNVVDGEHEEGTGTYNTTTGVLTRTTIRNSSNGGLTVNFSSAPVVYMGGPCATDAPFEGITDVAHGGTGVALLTAFAVLVGGITSTSPVQSVASVGTAYQVLTSNGAGALPSMQNVSSVITNRLGPIYFAVDYASVNAAITAIGSTQATLVVSGTQTLGAGTPTIPVTCALAIYDGGVIAKGSATSFTINGPFQAPLAQCFSGFAASEVTFGWNAVASAEWWGVTKNGSTDDYAALNSARRSISNGYVQLEAGSYAISATYAETRTSVGLRGRGRKVSTIVALGATIDAVSFTGTSGHNLEGTVAQDFSITRSTTPTGGAGLTLQFLASPIVKNISVMDSLVGYSLLAFQNGLLENAVASCSASFSNFIGVNLDGGGGGNISSVLRLVNVDGSSITTGAARNSSIGFKLYGANINDLTFDRCEGAALGTEFSIDGSTATGGSAAQDITIKNFMADSASVSCITVVSMPAPSQLTIIGGWLKSTGTAAISLITVHACLGSIYIGGGLQLFADGSASTTGIILEAASKGVTIDGVLMDELVAPIVFDGSGGAITDCSILNNVITNTVTKPATTMVSLATVQRITFSNNKLRGYATTGLSVTGTSSAVTGSSNTIDATHITTPVSSNATSGFFENAGALSGVVSLTNTASVGIMVPATVTGGAKGVGTINASNLYVEGNAVFTSATTVGVANGGTGITSYAAIGAMIYSAGTTSMAALAAVAAGSVLASAGVNTAPAWSATPALTSLALGGATIGSDALAITGTGTISSLWTAANLRLSTGNIYPSSNSTTALGIAQADGTTKLVTFDTSNKRVGINKTPGAFDLDVNGAVNFASTLAVTGAVTLTSTVNKVTITTPATAATLTLADNSTLATAGSLSLPITIQGDIWYGSAAGTLLALPKNASATRYLSNTGATNNPAWAQIDLSNGVTGLLPYANFTNVAGLSVVGRSASSSGVSADVTGTADQVLRIAAAGASLGFGSIDLSKSAAVGTSILPGANGGTGIAFFAVSGPATSLKTFTFPNASATVLTDNAAVTVAQGGTGVATFTTNGVLYGNSTTSILVTAQGGANTILVANSGAPSWTATPTINTSVTVPSVIGGTAAGSSLTVKSTSGVGTSDTILFLTGNSVEAARFTTGGLMMINATAAVYNERLLVADGTGTNVTATFKNTNSSLSCLNCWNSATSGDNAFILFAVDAGATTRGSITFNRGGTLTAYNTTSDARLKTHIRDAGSALDRIDAIKVRSFVWKENGLETLHGAVAQELLAVAPEAVTVGGDDPHRQPWQIDPSKLVMLLVKAVQELKAKITVLEARPATA